MVDAIYLTENEPYPNNPLPVLYYEDVLSVALGEAYTSQDVIELFTDNGYKNGWINGILNRHHFHSNAHEALACVHGEVTVQLGGPGGEVYTLRKGDVILLPAGVSHKRLDATEGFKVVGAYPTNESSYDMQYGDTSNYEAVKENIAKVEKTRINPVTGSPENIEAYWK